MPDLFQTLLGRPPQAPPAPLAGVGPQVNVINPWEGQPPPKATLLPQAGTGVSEASDPLLKAGQLIRGAAGLGDNSMPSRGGEMLAAMMAIPAPARALTAILEPRPPALDPLKVLAMEKATGWVPKPGLIKAPEGFTFGGAQTGELARSPELARRFEAEQARFATQPPVRYSQNELLKNLVAQRSAGNRSNVILTPDVIRDIRKVHAQLEAEGKLKPRNMTALYDAFPDVKRPTLLDVVKRNSWSWIQ